MSLQYTSFSETKLINCCFKKRLKSFENFNMFYVFKIAQNLVKNVLASDDFGTIGLYLGMLQDSRLKSKFDSQFLCREIRTLNTHGLSPCKVRNLAATLVCLKSVLACISIFGESLNFVNKFHFFDPKSPNFRKNRGQRFV